MQRKAMGGKASFLGIHQIDLYPWKGSLLQRSWMFSSKFTVMKGTTGGSLLSSKHDHTLVKYDVMENEKTIKWKNET